MNESENSRWMSPEENHFDHDTVAPSVDRALRPQSLDEYIGQTKAKNNLKLFIDAASGRNEPLDHVLLAGPPGLGKTTLAHIISHQMKSQIHIVSGPNVEKKGDIAAILANLQPKDVLFIDEIHRIQKAVEEVLYSAMEDFKLDIVIGQGPGARTLRIDIPPFTLVGATTRTGLLSNPFRDRFGIQLRLEFYPVAELEQILMRSASLLGLDVDSSGANEIAKRSRGTPRILNRLLKRVRDFVQVQYPNQKVSREVAKKALLLMEVDERGLDWMDRKILRTIIERFDGGPVGIDSLSSAVGEEADTLEDVYEPYLVQEGFLQRTSRGRVTGKLAYDHLGIPLPAQAPVSEIPQINA